MKISPAALAALAQGDLENARIASTPGGIERQEKQGQIDESLRDTLPIDGTIGEGPPLRNYKAAFYDRHAHVYLVARFRVSRTYDNSPESFVFVEDAMGIVKERRGPFPSQNAVPRGDDAEWRRRYDRIQEEVQKLTAWLVERYPEYGDAAKYWDEVSVSEEAVK